MPCTSIPYSIYRVTLNAFKQHPLYRSNNYIYFWWLLTEKWVQTSALFCIFTCHQRTVSAIYHLDLNGMSWTLLFFQSAKADQGPQSEGERKCDNRSIGNIGGPVSDHVAGVSNHHTKMEGGRWGGPKTVPKGGPVNCVLAKQYETLQSFSMSKIFRAFRNFSNFSLVMIII